jgi:quercetin dioxygenase-like cupin family protein
MPLVTFDDETSDNKVAGYSDGQGSVLRSEHFEAAKIHFPKGKGAKAHRHPEEQFSFVVSGRLLVTAGDDGEITYEVGPGQATFNPSNILHGVEALEDTVVLSLKAPLISDDYTATGELS